MKILYFTSSGNCLAAARHFKAEYLSIPQMIKNGEYRVEDDAVGIVYPVYGNSVPGIVRRWLKRCTIRAGYVFVIATYGNLAGGSLNEMKRLLTSAGTHADYLVKLLTVDNYLPFFEIHNQVSRLEEKKTQENLQRIVREVSERKKQDVPAFAAGNILSMVTGVIVRGTAPVIPLLMFKVSSACTRCGICTRVCPRGNVRQNGRDKPSFGRHCESCLACVHNCPQGAIHLRIERSPVRYRSPEVTLKDIIEANRQN